MSSTALPLRSTSRSRSPPQISQTTKRIPSRPTTPLRPSSRTSLRSSTTPLASHHSTSNSTSNPLLPGSSTSTTSSYTPLLSLETPLADLADSTADLEANFMHLQLMAESLNRFNENFAALLYGLNMNAFCVDWGEMPVKESLERAGKRREEEEQEDVEERGRMKDERGPVTPRRGGGRGVGRGGAGRGRLYEDMDSTFLTAETSFSTITQTPSVAAISRSGGSRLRTPARKSGIVRGMGHGGGQGGARGRGGGGGGGGTTAGGVGRGNVSTRGSGIVRGRGRGRGGVR